MRCGIILKKRRKIWVWFAVSRATRRVLALEVGSRGKKTLRRLLAKLNRFNVKQFCTDHWKIYRVLIDKDKLVQSKRYTTVVESINCNVRQLLGKV